MASSYSTFDYGILGAGIAGLSLADALSERGKSVCLIERNHIGAGASGTPGALVNPATGRRATKTWQAENCYKAIRANLEKVESFSDLQFYQNNGLLRPALSPKMARKMSEQYEKNHWPEGWCSWLSEKEIKERHPGIECVEGGLWLPIGLTVDPGEYLRALGRYLQSREVHIITGQHAKPREHNSHWTLELSDRKIKADRLVYATGYHALSVSYWKEIPLHPIKGQVMRFRKTGGPLAFSHSISSLGYLANIGDHHSFVQGSTYEHDFDELKSDDYGEEYLRGRLRKTLPGLEKEVIAEQGWAGVRMSTPNKKPVLGRHHAIPHLYLFTGLGSKGLMYGKFLADHYADYLLEGTPLFKAVSIDRFYEEEPD